GAASRCPGRPRAACCGKRRALCGAGAGWSARSFAPLVGPVADDAQAARWLLGREHYHPVPHLPRVRQHWHEAQSYPECSAAETHAVIIGGEALPQHALLTRGTRPARSSLPEYLPPPSA